MITTNKNMVIVMCYLLINDQNTGEVLMLYVKEYCAMYLIHLVGQKKGFRPTLKEL